MMLALALSTLLSVGIVAIDDDEIVHQGAGFTIRYPEDDSRVQPPSAAVPFQLVYRKNSLLRLETERLTQPIDLRDETFATIFKDVQLERLRERVRVPLEMERVRQFSWGVGIEFHYFLPARSGKRNERDLVTEVVTTVEDTLFRFTYWIPEKDLNRVAAPFALVVESFRPETGLASVPGISDVRETASGSRYSVSGSEAAARELRENLKQDDLDPRARGGLYAQLAATLGWKGYLTQALSASELDELKRSAEEAMRGVPQTVDAQHARAWAAFQDNRMVEMEEAIQAASRIEPENAKSHLLRALWYRFNPERSVEMAQQAIDADSGYVAAYYVKAVADRRRGDLLAARYALEEAVKRDPGFIHARVELAEVLGESGDAPAALDAYRAAAAAAPQDLDVRFRYALSLRRAGQIDAAITEYENLLRSDASLSEVHYNLAVLYLQERQLPDLAREHFRQFIELDPNNERATRVRDWLSSNPPR